jgi:ADP-ribose pyrophosphatase
MAKWLDRHVVYQGQILQIWAAELQLDDDHVVAYDIVEHHGGVAVVPLLDDRVVLVKQPRYVVGQSLLEIPAGKLEGPDDDIIARAQAELGEETGYRAGRLIQAAEFYVSPGYCTERIHVFLGLELERIEAAPQAHEEIECVELPMSVIRQMLAEGQFHDSKTIIGLHALLDYLEDRG